MDRPEPHTLEGEAAAPAVAPRHAIRLEGVRVHNLKDVSLDLPLRRLIVVSGVSGSGKSSLAFNTLYAEGQRRYIESFSPYARQFLDRMERPDADRIDNIPPALAVRQSSVSLSAKSTVATATEIHDYLRLLFARVGRIICPDCRVEVRRETPESVLAWIRRLPDGMRFMVAFPTAADDPARLTQLREEGFTRVVIGGRLVNLIDADVPHEAPAEIHVIVDRLTAGKVDEGRAVDSLELAFRQGEEQCLVLTESAPGAPPASRQMTVDGRTWDVHLFRGDLVCPGCGRQYVEPDPRLFSFNNPLGACPACEGFGSVTSISFDRVVPDPSKSLRDGAIAPWTTPAYRHELDELLALAPAHRIPVDAPFTQLTDEHRRLIMEGVPARRFGGLTGFFRWLERHKYKLSARIFLNRWRSYETCPTCHGARLRPEALAVRLVVGSVVRGPWSVVENQEPALATDHGPRTTDTPNIAEFTRWDIRRSTAFLQALPDALTEAEREITRTLLRELDTRTGYLAEVGLDYLTLDRPIRTLSGGEAQRVALTATLGSSLVNTLYVLDEPSAGLHPRDNERVINAVRRLRDAGNTVIVVEHDEAFIRRAELVVDIGPGAGRDGGRVVYMGTPDELTRCEESVTGAYLAGRLSVPAPQQRRTPQAGRLVLRGARQHNLKNLTVEFPLGVLCVVTGVSGSGKSTLVEDTLYPALCRALKQSCARETPGECDGLDGVEHIDEVILADQTPIGRTSRSNPVTYIGAFDEIRKIFAATPEAKVRNFTAAQFSFNAANGGRCPHCQGSGTVEIDMQFLSDVSMTCPECHGTRFRREVLEVKYRGRSIADVLAMTVREAFAFFRTHRKLQKQLQFLKEVGVDYLPLGQPATTLSGGESQRLKLASFLASGTRSRTLFLIDEPTVGLHAADVARLLQCFDSLLAVGHSLIVVEHDLDVIRAADHVIDLGPEAGDAGGEVVAAGSPEEIARCDRSVTGRYLRAGCVA